MLHQIHSEFMEIRFKLDQILQRIAYQGSRHVERSSVGAQLVAASLFLLVVTSVLVAVGMWLPDVRQPHHQQQRSQQRRQQLSLPPPPSTRRSGVDWTRKTARPRKYFNVHEVVVFVVGIVPVMHSFVYSKRIDKWIKLSNIMTREGLFLVIASTNDEPGL